MKKSITLAIVLALTLALVACSGISGTNDNDVPSLTIAYQYGMAYAPLQIMQEQKLIEKHYEGDVEIVWQLLNSGAAINEGFASGSIDAGAMGVAPALTGMHRGVPYRIFSNLSSQPHRIMTNKDSILSLSDITSQNKIALVNIGSIQHILLAMAAENELGDAHALDNNIIAMSHPDGMAALMSGSVDCQLTTSPYVFKEAADPGIHSISSISDVWPDGNSFIVGLASTKLYTENPALYQALVLAMEEAIDYLNNNRSEAAATLCENEGVDTATMETWLSDPACGYFCDTKGIMQMTEFMFATTFLQGEQLAYSDLVYDNVTGD